MIKLAVFDIDGTLYPIETHSMAKETEEALHTLKRNGIKIALATGRQYGTIHKELKEIGFDYYICSNGSCITDSQGNPIVVHYLTKEIADELTKDFLRLNHPIMFRHIEGGKDMNPNIPIVYYSQYFFNKGQLDKSRKENKKVDIPEDSIPFAALAHVEPEDLDFFKQKYPDLNFLITGKGLTCDITWNYIDKGAGIREICKYLNIDIKESIAFGDDGNDVHMMEAAGIGVAMGNAVSDVKEKADYITDNSIDLGVVKALQHFGLI